MERCQERCRSRKGGGDDGFGAVEFAEAFGQDVDGGEVVFAELVGQGAEKGVRDD
jgi:hypothetical protein